SSYGACSARRCLPTAWRRLASRAEVGAPVHEVLAHHGRTAPRARQPGPSVDIERTVEVSGGAVDVDVEGVERRPSLLERVGHHVTRMVQDLDHRRQGGGPGSATAVDAGAPERLVGVDVADAG